MCARRLDSAGQAEVRLVQADTNVVAGLPPFGGWIVLALVAQVRLVELLGPDASPTGLAG